ncbi:hypothetical protein [Aquisphaera insulae]|uniref:hypothetical protein n=1 Tax=Aquisphaera insulae TaxID=2712864 RepID=UPI0013E9EE0E|nr:hypothetical protein [Aquisphaera insulae]
MRFRYLRDPLFLVCLTTYFINRWVFKAILDSGFVHDHLNDLICIPFWVPIMVWMERRLGVRRHDGPPDVLEIAAPLVIWSWVFEVALPRTTLFSAYCKADHQDVMYYALGAFGAVVFWRWWYGGREAVKSSPLMV